jgi:hypothetical protein
MINGAHVILYSKDAEADRAFFRDFLRFPAVDAGHGWLIFALPPAEIAMHPAEKNASHELYLMCPDLKLFFRHYRQTTFDSKAHGLDGAPLCMSTFQVGRGSVCINRSIQRRCHFGLGRVDCCHLTSGWSGPARSLSAIGWAARLAAYVALLTNFRSRLSHST